MERLTKIVARQDANFKLSPSASNETSINLAQDISQLLSDKSEEVTFTLFKDDFIRALGMLCLLDAVYFKKNTQASSIAFIYDMLSEDIKNHFGDNQSSKYTVYHQIREDGRNYLNNLKSGNGFNIRDFIVEKLSHLEFIKNDRGDLELRIHSYISRKEDASFHENLGDKIDPIIIEKIDYGYEDYLRAMRTKPFLLLAGISGTGKSRIVKQMAFDSCPNLDALRKDPASPGNYCLIEVKPNWHDSTELLGYESKIGGAHYQLTPFVKFLAKAMLYPDVPFFVCLDEMNLAPVEQYFAEFLSVLESRTKKDGHIISEPLIKADIFRKYGGLEKSLFSLEEDIKSEENSYHTTDPETTYGKETEVFAQLKENGLRIPENVVIIGTVNMDETTHQFSRKVIDRAMTIEMNLPEGDPFMDFFESSSTLEYREVPSSASLYLSTEVRAADVIEVLTSDNAEETELLKHQVANFLKGLNAALDKTPFQVAYRVQNELLLYFYQLWLEDKSVAWSDILTNACDQILMMKVLPRIEGDEELLEKPLKKLAEFCQPYSNASKKLAFMTERLAQSRFASFWP